MCLPWHAGSLCRGPCALAHPFGCPSTTSGGLHLQRRLGGLVAPCSPMATGGAAAGILVPCLRAKDFRHPGFRGDGDPAYGPSLVVGSCPIITMNWASGSSISSWSSPRALQSRSLITACQAQKFAAGSRRRGAFQPRISETSTPGPWRERKQRLGIFAAIAVFILAAGCKIRAVTAHFRW